MGWLDNAAVRYKARRLYRLDVKRARISNEKWIDVSMGDMSIYPELVQDALSSSIAERRSLVAFKPRRFRDIPSLASFLGTLSSSMPNHQATQVTIEGLRETATVDELAEGFANLPYARRLKMDITVKDLDGATLAKIHLRSEGGKWTYTAISLDPRHAWPVKNILDGHRTEELGWFARRRPTPLVEPIDSKEESQRRENWKNIRKNMWISGITGLLTGAIIPLFRILFQL